jgi:hypothetical protein
VSSHNYTKCPKCHSLGNALICVFLGGIMRIAIIIAIVVGIWIMVAIVVGYQYIQNQIVIDQPWVGLTCDGMLDFSATDEHQGLTMEQHMEFHNHYYDNCSDTELGKP